MLDAEALAAIRQRARSIEMNAGSVPWQGAAVDMVVRDVPVLLAEVDRLQGEVQRYALLASVTTSERLAGVEVPPDVAARLLAEQERDEARAELARAEQEREQYRVALEEVEYLADCGMAVKAAKFARAALAGREASEEATT